MRPGRCRSALRARSSSVSLQCGEPLDRSIARRAAPAARSPVGYPRRVRLVIAKCSVDYVGRLSAHLPPAVRLLMVKADGSVSIHADDRAYKPLNWMSPPCKLQEAPGRLEGRQQGRRGAADHPGGDLPGHLVRAGRRSRAWSRTAWRRTCRSCWPRTRQTFGEGCTLVRREYMTAIGPVDLLCRDAAGGAVAVEIKRRGEIDGVEQLTRYLELMNRDPLLAPVQGVFAAQEIKPQARVLATDRGHPLRGGRLRQAARHGARRADPLLARPASTRSGDVVGACR